GYLGILAGHAPLVTELAAGEITYRRPGETQPVRLAVAWGFAEVLPDRTTLLAEIAEKPEEIDVEMAKKLRAQALERLRNASEVEDVHRYTRDYETAQNRIEVAARAGFSDMANIVP
ncbi:MAG: ATP synthase F1 subunit epsilon, partial [Acidobacteriales bacterium]|nr:ATP synthase F1 subunit epsilon [Terriglobales bacterium]